MEEERKHPVVLVSHFVHHHFLWFLLGSYAVASGWPALGLWMRGIAFGKIHWFDEQVTITLPMLMLALLLLNAGLGVQLGRLRDLVRSPGSLIGGLCANVLIPILFIFGVCQTMRFWHNPMRFRTSWLAWP
jgi:BASS family bile acid:Na+ symporter